MGFFDSISDLFSAAAPWETSEAEAVREGGTGTDSTPAQPKGGEGEAKDPSGPTPDKKSNDKEEVGGKDAEGNHPSPNPADGEDAGEDADAADDDEEEEEEEDEEEIVDPKETYEAECRESKQCAPAKHHYDACVERVTGAGDGESKESCVEEFFHLAHCANQCAAPKLWAALK